MYEFEIKKKKNSIVNNFSIDSKDPQKYGNCMLKNESMSHRTSELTIGPPIPECDAFGHYIAKQCKEGTL